MNLDYNLKIKNFKKNKMNRKRYAGGGDIQKSIDELQLLIDNPDVNEVDRNNFREIQAKYKEKLKAEKPTEKSAEKPTEKKKPRVSKVKPKVVAKKETKPKETKPKEKKVPKGVQLVSKKKAIIDGKEVSTDSKEFCDYITAEFIKRREKAKEIKGQRKKTKSVMAQVTSKIESGIEKAIKTGISKQIPSLKKNPKVFIGKVEKLEVATKNFLQELKSVLGDEYDAEEIAEARQSIQNIIADLKKKYISKK